ncbi:hypothetical protein [Microbaculum marinisediminis]|uniref:Uncharacterized protein n=1 Tax=Microbaculum marinisediminis TaxID=2931392 RepID=A0AAW5R5U5_9HYPH|nr:hypothetical protein [Microbaculum sp. A6E488]MCT8973999.1 hypothetical protein [Microbaculum sp. A6E488]
MTTGSRNSWGGGEPAKGGAVWSRIVRIVLRSFAGLIAIVLVAFLYATGLFAEFVGYLWPSVYYTEVVADVTAEGQRYELKSVARYETRPKARFGGLVGGGNPTVKTGGLMTKRLPSGAGLIIIGPALCSKSDLYGIIQKEDFASPYDVRNVDLQRYLVFRGAIPPKILWLDDAKDPSLIRAYWEGHVTREGADVQVHSIRYRRLKGAPSAVPENPEREVPWLEGRKAPSEESCYRGPAAWVGFYSYAVGEEVWSEIKGFDHLGHTGAVEPIRSGLETLNMNRRPIQRVSLDEEKNAFIFEKPSLKNEGYYEYQRRSLLNGKEYPHQFEKIVNNKRYKLPNTTFFENETNTIRNIGVNLYGKEYICR